MKQVYKCEFCGETEETQSEIIEHEDKCGFNPKNKACFSCKNKYYDYDVMFCNKGISTEEGEEGDCDLWIKK